MPRPRSKIRAGVVCPTPQEYAALRAGLKLDREEKIGGRYVSRREERKLSLAAVKAWPGKAAAASAVQLLADVFGPRIILDVGAAGALDPSLPMGTVLCADRAFEYDVDPVLAVATALAGASRQAETVMKEFIRKAGVLLPGPPLVRGDIASGERDVADSAFRDFLRTRFGASACDWETAAVIRTASRNGIPVLSFRVVTDRADENLEADYRRNLSRALDRLGAVAALFIEGGWLGRFMNS